MGGSNANNDVSSTFIIAYYNAARADMMQRLILRESMLTVFLVAVAALTSVAFSGGTSQRYAFFAIPILGFGVAASYVHHVAAVRALWTYLTTEYQQDVETLLGRLPLPRHFDISASHPEMASSRMIRLAGTLALIVVPQILATAAGAVTLGLNGPAVWAFTISIVAIAGTMVFLIYGYLSRSKRRQIAEQLRLLGRTRTTHNSAIP
ncbi:MAG: hypothetical protein H0X25_21410 [Acidobacteriales bacterium]|nr:hypothetical protein [Terriglobales bacterium]